MVIEQEGCFRPNHYQSLDQVDLTMSSAQSNLLNTPKHISFAIIQVLMLHNSNYSEKKCFIILKLANFYYVQLTLGVRKYHQRFKEAQNQFILRSQYPFGILSCGHIMNTRPCLLLNPSHN